MKNLANIIEISLIDFSTISQEEWEHKKSDNAWSKKEIVGHLIDSAINNLQRFTEIQFQNDDPYLMRKYDQNALVIANNYQNASIDDLLAFWKAINAHIWFVIQNQSPASLLYEVQINEETVQTLQWLMEDYIVHLEHHLNQIKS